MSVNRVNHIDVFFAIYREFVRIGLRFVRGKRADLFAAALRVLELMRNEQISRLLSSGVEESQIREDMLGFAMTWNLFSRRANGHYSARSFESIIEQVLRAGVASRLYVECHRRKGSDSEKQGDLVLVCDQAGRPILYQTVEEAWANRRDGGDIVNYFYFHAEKVNRLIEEIYGLSAPTPPTTPGGGQKQKKRGAQREALAHADAELPPAQDASGIRGEFSDMTDTPEPTIPLPSQNCEGNGTQRSQGPRKSARDVASPSQNCEAGGRKTAGEDSQNCGGIPRKTASNKNSKKNPESLLKEESISASRAIALSQFDFSQPISADAIRTLSRLIYAPLPVRYRTEADKEAAYARIDQAAEALAAMPLVREIGLRRLAAMMAYQADEHSPCKWRAWCRRTYHNPGFVPRLWHLESEPVLQKTLAEMEACGWWPDSLPRLRSGLVETPPDIDLMALAGIHPDDRVGMDSETASSVCLWLHDLLTPYGYTVSLRALGHRYARERGFAIEVHFDHDDGTRRILRFYHFDDWDLIVQADTAAPIGSLKFVEYLAEALRRGQVA